MLSNKVKKTQTDFCNETRFSDQRRKPKTVIKQMRYSSVAITREREALLKEKLNSYLITSFLEREKTGKLQPSLLVINQRQPGIFLNWL